MIFQIILLSKSLLQTNEIGFTERCFFLNEKYKVLQKDVKNIDSKHILARWQFVLVTSIFKFNLSKEKITQSLIVLRVDL